jgi:hypothetical protein
LKASVQFLRDCLQVQQIPGMHRKRKGKRKGTRKETGRTETDTEVDSEPETDGYGIVHLTDKAHSEKVNL